jgi:hypothetical protein
MTRVDSAGLALAAAGKMTGISNTGTTTPMGQLSLGQLAIILLSVAMWVGAAWAIIIAVRKMGLFGRKPK